MISRITLAELPLGDDRHTDDGVYSGDDQC